MDFRSLDIEYYDDEKSTIYRRLRNSLCSISLKDTLSKLKRLNISLIGCCCEFRRKHKNYRDNGAMDHETLEPENPNLRMVSGSFYIPKDEKRNPKGEDAHFICADEEAIGVADGVGSWAKHGVDAGEYARALMHNAATAARSAPTNPKSIIRSAFSASSGIAEGSSTACVVVHRNGVLSAANVGDSGFMVFRDGSLLARSQPQLRGFNCPYQLGNGDGYDRPRCAEEWGVSVAAGDVVVLGTDGLLDNMFAEQVERIVREGVRDGYRPEKLAKKIAKKAYSNSIDERCDTPFGRDSWLAGYLHLGGKRDDITVVVGLIVMC